ncbi:hypothetical protein ACETRX_32325 [Labrys portucalensis]|uniref:Uncharacterized protein n=1 Tax=Labrys neptuniae TaxID=376174 RepID=A0ABV6ZQ72_9HYPH
MPRQLFGRSVRGATPRAGHVIWSGISDNTVKIVDNCRTSQLGFVPLDNSEPFLAVVEARTPVPDPRAPRANGGQRDKVLGAHMSLQRRGPVLA